MIHYFLDSSALAKRYIVEPGTQWIRKITASTSPHPILTAEITQVELISAAARRSREGQISTTVLPLIRAAIDRHFAGNYLVVQQTPLIISRAKDLLQAYPLRAYDAIQLSSALEAALRVQSGGNNDFVFVSADQRLLNIAVAEGLMTDDPGNHL